MKKPKPVRLMRELRRRESNAEAKLWFYLRSRQLNGIKFRRQQPLGRFIVDFISFETKLIIEVDGGQHNEMSNIRNDEQRTQFLENSGYKVIRFWNNGIY
jgi:very-short-patch-repair endonuclease